MTMRTQTLSDLAGSDTIDSRDLIARLEELERNAGVEDDDILDDDEREELAALRDICERGSAFSDWPYGEALIRESYFKEYAQDYAADIGAIAPDAQWPLSYIDWDAAADALKMDYSTIEIEGTTYYGR